MRTIGPYADGTTLAPADLPRIASQLERVRLEMISGHWRTLGYLSQACRCSEASASARIRDCRNKLGYFVERRSIGAGLFQYRMTVPKPEQLSLIGECA